MKKFSNVITKSTLIQGTQAPDPVPLYKPGDSIATSFLVFSIFKTDAFSAECIDEGNVSTQRQVHIRI